MKLVKHIIGGHSQDLASTTPDKTVFEALQTLAEYDVGALLVFDENKHLVGMFSERDYARKVILHNLSSKTILVKDIMTDTVVCITPDRTVEECMAIMTKEKIRHLPVLGEGGEVVGIVSIGDIVKEAIKEREFVIGQLVSYITGDRS